MSEGTVPEVAAVSELAASPEFIVRKPVLNLEDSYFIQKRLMEQRRDRRMLGLMKALTEAGDTNLLPEPMKRIQGALLTEQAMGLVREVTEFLAENDYTKRWKEGGHPPINHKDALLELADVYIFWTNLCVLSGYSPEEVLAAWIIKTSKNERRAASVVAGTGWEDRHEEER